MDGGPGHKSDQINGTRQGIIILGQSDIGIGVVW